MDLNHHLLKHPSFKGLVGVAQVDITPPPGIYSRSWGASKYDIAEGVHQPLKLTAISFLTEDKKGFLLLISADLGWWKNSEDEWALRNKLLETFSLEPSHLMFCLTHTHAGPGICSEDASNPGGHLIKGYLDLILEQSISAITESLANAKSAVLTWHYGKCDLATNRDLPQAEKNRMVVGFNPEESADDTLLVGRVTDEQDRIFATIVNYACHPTTLAWENRLISPDYIGSMRDLVQDQTKGPCLFLQGASGELAPAEQYVGDTEIAERYGRRLGYAVLATLESMLPPGCKLLFGEVVESGAPLGVWVRSAYELNSILSGKRVQVQLPLKPLPTLSAIEAQWAQSTDRVMKERLWRKRGVRRAVGDGDHADIGLWIWQLGESFLIGQPNEAYSHFQLELRRELSPYAVGVINVANGHIGYLAPKELYSKDVYSVWQTPFAAGSLELLITKAKKVAKEMMKSGNVIAFK